MGAILNVSGLITEKGLSLPMEIVRDFCRKNAGRRAVVRIECFDRKTSAAQRGYYYGYIVPEVRAGLAELGTLLTDEQVDGFLRTECPLCWKGGAPVSVAEMDFQQMGEFIDWIKVYAAENLSVFIEDSRVL